MFFKTIKQISDIITRHLLWQISVTLSIGNSISILVTNINWIQFN